jgi:exodeoxyribonuclease-1
VALYDGLVDDAERARLDAVHRRAPEELAELDPGFADGRLQALYFRYRARNWPGTLHAAERHRWRALRWQRLCQGEAGSPRTVARFRDELQEGVAAGRLATELALELEAWADELVADLPPCDGG